MACGVSRHAGVGVWQVPAVGARAAGHDCGIDRMHSAPMTTIDYVHRLVIPAAYDLLPLHMASVEATAMLLAVGWQESDSFRARAQYEGGPARGFWQFER